MKRKQGMWSLIVVTILGFFAIIIAGCVMVYVILRDADIDQDNQLVSDIRSIVVKDPCPVNDTELDENLLRQIDFDELQSINPDAQRWIYIPDTNIDYYVMQEQTIGSTYYLWRDINKKKSSWGSILTLAEPMDFDDAHLLIFGHRMSNRDIAFGQLTKCYESESDADEHPYIYLYYPDRAERWVVWTSIKGQESDMIYDIPYQIGSDKYQDLIDDLKSKALYERVETPSNNIAMIVLSTCNGARAGSSSRFQVIAVPEACYYYDTQILEKGYYYEHEKEVTGED